MEALPPNLHQGGDLPGPCTCGSGLMRRKKQFPAVAGRSGQTCRGYASGPAAESRLTGCFASGESRGIMPRGKRAFPWAFSRLSMGQKPSIVRISRQQAEVVCFSIQADSPNGVQRPKAFGAGLGARSAQRSHLSHGMAAGTKAAAAYPSPFCFFSS